MRLTADVIAACPAYVNAVGDHELDLRGKNIPAIENLGATQDLYDTLDLCDNDLPALGGFPKLGRLSTLLLHSNRISRIDGANLASSLPRLSTIALHSNQLVSLDTLLSDLAPLKSSGLRSLSLIDNPVAKHPEYRLKLIHTLPCLRLLDWRKVTLQERAAAKEAYGSAETIATTATTATTANGDKKKTEGAAGKKTGGKKKGKSAKTFDVGAPLNGQVEGTTNNNNNNNNNNANVNGSNNGTTDPAVSAAVDAALEAVTSLAEMEALTVILNSGNVPPDAKALLSAARRLAGLPDDDGV